MQQCSGNGAAYRSALTHLCSKVVQAHGHFIIGGRDSPLFMGYAPLERAGTDSLDTCTRQRAVKLYTTQDELV